MTIAYLRTLFLSLLCGISFCAQAQLKADFTIDKNAGCAPLLASFSNTSTGLSPDTRFLWDFGNGNTSVLKDPGAIFTAPGTYTVSLTLSSTTQTSSLSKTITVYKTPTADFSVSSVKGCAPFEVTFTSTASPGDGSIASYFWDFGDGVTMESLSPSISHTYLSEQPASVSLTVKNSFGCYTTVEKKDLVQVLQPLIPSFKQSVDFLCRVTDPVTMKNQSTGPGTLSYLWEFGDGTTSTEKEPVHVFNSSGAYRVKLTLSSSEGCRIALSSTDTLYVANFRSSIEEPAKYCLRNTQLLTNTSYPKPTTYRWEVNGTQMYQFQPGPLQYYPPDTGVYRISLINQFGSCYDTLTKIVNITRGPQPEGFLVRLKDRCTNPQEWVLTDTTKGAVSWLWQLSTGHGAISKEAVFPLSNDGEVTANLFVKDANGCTTQTAKTFEVRRAYGEIEFLNGDGRWAYSLCGRGDVEMRVKTRDTLVTFLWSSGDGQLSNLSQPKFRYDKVGDFFPEVSVQASDGCKYLVKSPYPVMRRDSIKARFTTASLEICGNTPTLFKDSSSIPATANQTMWGWQLGEKESWYAFSKDANGNFVLQFRDTGVYRVRYVVADYVCWDTAEAFIRVLPPVPRIRGVVNTCEGTRGNVTINYDAGYAISGIWNFGDGTTAPLVPGSTSVQHEYLKSGQYKAVLTMTNGACTVSDSTIVRVARKQNPVLTSNGAEVCRGEGEIQFKVSGLEPLPFRQDYPYVDIDGYTFFEALDQNNKYLSSHITWQTSNGSEYTIRKYGFLETADQLRFVVRSTFFGCPDTSNTIPVKVKGPTSGIKVINTICPAPNTVTFGDSSKTSFGNPIVKWEWSTGIEPTVTRTDNSEFPFRFNSWGYKVMVLKVTDAAGCSHTSHMGIDLANLSQKAGFTASSYQISPGTTVQFNNTSTTNDPGNTAYDWSFGDGSVSGQLSPSKRFDIPGTYVVRLVSRNTVKSCTDTATATIVVRNVNAVFSISSNYLTTANCPPVRVQFSNSSINVVRTVWDFGDGSVSSIYSPSHVYTRPGTYVVRVTTYSDNGTAYSASDTVRISAPSASIDADSLTGCTNKLVNFKASAAGTKYYFWDFGDGNVVSTSDSTAPHHFMTSGVFRPRLIVKDNNGCAVSALMADSVKIDSLGLQLLNLPAQLCAPRTLDLKAAAVTAVQGQSLSYAWTAGQQTSSSSSASFTFNTAGNYPVQLTVRTQYGCEKTITRNLVAFQGLGAVINGPDALCEGASARYTATTQIAGSPQWKWTFPDGSSAAVADPSAYLFKQAGTYPVQLVVLNNGCNDTLTRTVTVYPNPSGILAQRTATLCSGAAIELNAQGAAGYRWTPASGLLSDTGRSVMAAPTASTTYIVTATSVQGCVGKDSTRITVVAKQLLQLPAEISFCAGTQVQLKASGTDRYQWIGNTTGLSSTSIGNPMARPTANVTYMVVGSDDARCFTDTAIVRMVLLPSPTVDAGPGGEVSVGASFPLNPAYSTDVKSYRWSPDKYLSCATCPTPLSTPMENVNYTLTVVNNKGCVASDTVTVNVMCNESRIYIPNIFTPNGDGKNDVFMLAGQGIKLVKSLRIFDRFGSVIFERQNFQVNDPSSAWNGKIGSALVPAGSYVYMAELSCDEKSFVRKGTVTVVY